MITNQNLFVLKLKTKTSYKKTRTKRLIKEGEKMDINQFLKRQNELVRIDSFNDFTLYYDEKDKSLWIWNGTDFIGKSVGDLYEELMELV